MTVTQTWVIYSPTKKQSREVTSLGRKWPRERREGKERDSSNEAGVRGLDRAHKANTELKSGCFAALKNKAQIQSANGGGIGPEARDENVELTFQGNLKNQRLILASEKLNNIANRKEFSRNAHVAITISDTRRTGTSNRAVTVESSGKL